MAAKKIALIITKLELGGAQKSVLYTAKHLDKFFEPFLLTGPGGYFDEYAKKHLKNLIFIKDLERKINLIKDTKAFFELTKNLLKIKPDIVHTNSSKAGILGRKAAFFYRLINYKRRKQIKIIHTVHGFAFYEGQNKLVHNFYIWLERMLAKITDEIIFVSVMDLGSALKHKIAPPAKCRLIR
ncbi:MAG: glycosyltransferase, partial [Elusimicrobiota bacterium]|nr:glycosyltransferase [Elusimicrobiota bacterium]